MPFKLERQTRIYLALVAGLLLFLTWHALAAAGGRQLTEGPAPLVDGRVQQALAQEGAARVLITLRDEGSARGGARLEHIAQAQAAVLAQLPPGAFDLGHRYSHVPGMAGRLTPAGLQALRQSAQVVAVHPDEPGTAHLAQSVPALEADVVHNAYGLTGAGVTVAVLDSGVDTDHPDLGDDLVAQHCFTDGACPPDGDDEGASAEDENGHGTNVAGIVTARGAASGPGFAPDAAIVAVRVLDGANRGWVSDWVAGLNWLIANQGSLGVDIVNMSLGTWALYGGNCDGQQPLLAAAIAQLYALDVAVFASTGNQGAANAIAAPACNTGVVAVAATYDGNLGREPDAGSYREWLGPDWPECFDSTSGLQLVTCFSNSSSMVDVVAPGSRIGSAGLGGGTSVYIGTSQAARSAAGIAALMRQADPQLSPAALEQLLKAHGRPVADLKSGRTFPLINARAAVLPLLPVAPAAADLAGPALGSTGVPYAFTATVQPLTATQPLTYRWQAAGQAPLLHSAGSEDSTTFAWSAPGTYAITVTVANEAGTISATHTISVSEVALQGVAIAGSGAGSVGVPHPLLAAVSPVTASQPITYVWQVAGQAPLTAGNGPTNLATFTWPLTGTYALTLTAANPLTEVSDTYTVTVNAVAPTGVTIGGPGSGVPGMAYDFVAAVQPLTASRPLTYVWQAAGQAPLLHSGGPSDIATFTWAQLGTRAITLTVSNASGTISGTYEIEMVPEHHSHLPFVARP